MRLKNKVAIVTGGASGFGEGIVKRFAKEGAQVIVADINLEGAEKVTMEINDNGGNAIAFGVDVSDSKQTKNMIDRSCEAFGKLDILVQNAAIGMRPTPLVETSEEEFDTLFNINVKSVYLGAVHSVPIFRKQRSPGVIINTVSTAAIRPRPGLTAYNATKGSLVTMTKGLSLELAPDNIRVNGLCPVAGDTAMLDGFLGDGPKDESYSKFVSTVPLGRLCKPRDMANAALYLASDEADFITGVLLEVDGGRCV
ncbi:MAG: 3-oxoacyl-ACP reductase [Pelagibacterales bacterium]|mgnify:FL=1|nr:3-oxoacyl-ACP reductase [Pelagibacterales bacterium]PPR15962.1 MAG: 4-formylbenzenesulfonate dehydrogenase TsaC1/TsaC2 [Alphaproteobacteria bacterium MarineAlpha9_Bin3]|tara:strand:+ start:1885 stop:2646 length:762 start_codon:yes stop_codon:yes gene_type:complete